MQTPPREDTIDSPANRFAVKGRQTEFHTVTFKEIAKVHFQGVTVPVLLRDNANSHNCMYVRSTMLGIFVERFCYAIRYAKYRRRVTIRGANTFAK